MLGELQLAIHHWVAGKRYRAGMGGAIWCNRLSSAEGRWITDRVQPLVEGGFCPPVSLKKVAPLWN